MQQGRLQIRSSLSAFASLDCRLESAAPLALQAEALNTPASAFISVLSLVPRQGSGSARPAATLDPSTASSAQTFRTGIDLEGEVLAEKLGIFFLYAATDRGESAQFPLRSRHLIARCHLHRRPLIEGPRMPTDSDALVVETVEPSATRHAFLLLEERRQNTNLFPVRRDTRSGIP
jgi:hypothetical protein